VSGEEAAMAVAQQEEAGGSGEEREVWGLSGWTVVMAWGHSGEWSSLGIVERRGLTELWRPFLAWTRTAPKHERENLYKYCFS
jgi:hypothetical protein